MTTSMDRHGPVSPLAFSVLETALGPGIMAAARAFSTPLGEVAVGRVDTYLHLEVAPPPPALRRETSPQEAAAAAARSRAALDAAMARMREAWEREYLPEIHLHLAAWEAFDLPGAAMPELLVHLDDTVIRFGRLMELHFLAAFPADLALFELAALDPGGGDAFRLVAGFPNKAAEAGDALWRLSRAVRESPGVLATLMSRWPSTAHLLAALGSTPDGSEFRVRLRRYLEDYAQRAGRPFEFDHPSWVEDPTPVIDRLRACVAQSDDEDPARVREEQADGRELARARVRRHLGGAPPEVRERFEFLLAAASTGVVITEDRRFWIDFRASHKVRRVLSEFGWRLVPAAFNVPADVFLLTLDELAETAAAHRTPDRRGLVDARRAEMEGSAGARPPEQPDISRLLGIYCAPATT